MADPVKILIVDDSKVFRTILEKIISGIAGVQVVGTADSGITAIEFLRMRTVDLMTLDVEMPGMDGLETLKKMLACKKELKNTPDVLMVSSLTRTGSDTTLKALEYGAFDFIAKPAPEVPNSQESLTRMLQNAIAAWHSRKNRRVPLTRPGYTPGTSSASGAPGPFEHKPGDITSGRIPVAPTGFTYQLAKPSPHTKAIMAITIGVSTGGPKSLAEMLPKLCSMTTLPILLVQHMPPNFTKSLADSLNAKCSHEVVEGLPGTVVKDKTVYIAPGGNHMTVKARGSQFILENNQDPPENGCRPSVDVLFRSVAAAYPPDTVVGVILTGMGNDGTPSLPHLKNKNAYLIAQDEDSSVVFGMPRAAAATGLLDKVATLMKIPEAVMERVKITG
ncbi:MAG: chemotaxis-specific protein-glutamate methyltransferase CheB [Fibromonadaceae bacterium]|jgi:two-component system chemotaxis response regulator CheB|nr:chemotaxis-specific protein-glutamate methyltransferase CheB [Fibromonadaceae bacterium]